MKELVFNTGGRKLFNDDLQSLQQLVKSFESMYAGEQPFVISGVTVTLVSGNTYNISSGHVWLGSRVRYFSGANNVDLSTAKFINVKDDNESREYNDTLSRVAVTDFTCAFSSTTLGGANSLRVETNGNIRRYIKDVLGSKLLLLTPESALQTVSGAMRFTGSVTVEGAVQVNNSLTTQTITTNSLTAATSLTLNGSTVTSIKLSGIPSQVQTEIPSSKSVRDFVDGVIETTNTLLATKSDISDGNKLGFVQMYTGTLSGRFDATGRGVGEYAQWALCNGNNGTSDLRNLFVVGAGSSYSLGQTGGAATVLLTASQSGLPAHNHVVNDPGHTHPYYDNGETTGSGTPKFWAAGTNYAVSDKSRTSSIGYTGLTLSQNTAQNAVASHENRPPFHALYYIQYVGSAGGLLPG
jgi:microcystin-dependent protein